MIEHIGFVTVQSGFQRYDCVQQDGHGDFLSYWKAWKSGDAALYRAVHGCEDCHRGTLCGLSWQLATFLGDLKRTMFYD